MPALPPSAATSSVSSLDGAAARRAASTAARTASRVTESEVQTGGRPLSSRDSKRRPCAPAIPSAAAQSCGRKVIRSHLSPLTTLGAAVPPLLPTEWEANAFPVGASVLKRSSKSVGRKGACAPPPRGAPGVIAALPARRGAEDASGVDLSKLAPICVVSDVGSTAPDIFCSTSNSGAAPLPSGAPAPAGSLSSFPGAAAAGAAPRSRGAAVTSVRSAGCSAASSASTTSASWPVCLSMSSVRSYTIPPSEPPDCWPMSALSVRIARSWPRASERPPPRARLAAAA
mmetsp:Transcript_15795/g.49121  ORF Transcript_15795/g.49121 Transcript_15795/m.49121 type:complete len:286 (+) Transcript_15795:1395-2252(+)